MKKEKLPPGDRLPSAGLTLGMIGKMGGSLQTFIDAVPMVIIVIDLDHRIVLANRVARKMAGGIDPAAAGMKCFELSHHGKSPCDGINEPCPLRTIVETKAPVTVTHTHFDAEGNELLHEVTATPILDESGEVVRIIEACPDMTLLKRTEESLKERTHDLRRKVRELNCLYGISDLAAKPTVSLDELIEGTIDLIRLAWQYPDITCVRIVLEGWEFATDNFEKTRWKLAAPICVDSEPAGTLEVFYLEKRPAAFDGPFLEEEKALITAIARRLEMFLKNRRIEEELRALNENLEQKVAERTAAAERKAGQLRQLASELTQTEQRERQRLARMLHDHIQQLLVGARFHVGIVKQRHPGDSGLQQTIRQIDEMIDESIKAARSLTVELSPPILYEGGLPQVLDWLCCWIQEKHGLTVVLQAKGGADPDAEDIRVFLFQAVKELLFNVVKHAKTDHADVRLSQADGNRVRIVVSDSGAGFDPARIGSRGQASSVFGLFSIKERLELLGGKMEIDSAPGRGACITLLAPATCTRTLRRRP